MTPDAHIAAPVALPDGRLVVPGNRWDLAPDGPVLPAAVAVVIPYYHQQRDLELVLAALDLQTHPRDLIHVVIADDGSASPPSVPPTELRVTVVRQEDLGFRAAAARNLGAAAAEGAAVLCFLDADTVPEPDYLARITRLPAQLPDALVVGRRRHAVLDDMTPQRLPDWWNGAAAPPLLREPEWLADGYRASRNLLDIDHRSYRYVISSVMCCSADLFADIGGFDESFGRYGGEDWEFAHRAWVNGAVLHHARDAVAWHNGPDWADRSVADRRVAKNAEALTLARLITDPDARRPGLRYALPDVAVAVDANNHTPGSLVATVGALLHEDVGVWVDGPRAEPLLADIGADDPRLRAGPVPPDVLGRSRLHMSVEGRAVLPRDAVTTILRTCAEPEVGTVVAATDGAAVTCRSAWAVHRARRWGIGAGRISSIVRLDAGTLGLRAAEEPDLSW